MRDGELKRVIWGCFITAKYKSHGTASSAGDV